VGSASKKKQWSGGGVGKERAFSVARRTEIFRLRLEDIDFGEEQSRSDYGPGSGKAGPWNLSGSP